MITLAFNLYHQWDLEGSNIFSETISRNNESFFHRAGPREGAYVHGIFMEGARWDVQQGIIMESKLKELYPQMPVINIRVFKISCLMSNISTSNHRCIFFQALTQDKQDLRNMYECPVYKTRTRGPTYIWTFNLKTKDKPAKWTLAGVALLLQV